MENLKQKPVFYHKPKAGRLQEWSLLMAPPKEKLDLSQIFSLRVSTLRSPALILLPLKMFKRSWELYKRQFPTLEEVRTVKILDAFSILIFQISVMDEQDPSPG